MAVSGKRDTWKTGNGQTLGVWTPCPCMCSPTSPSSSELASQLLLTSAGSREKLVLLTLLLITIASLSFLLTLSKFAFLPGDVRHLLQNTLNLS